MVDITQRNCSGDLNYKLSNYRLEKGSQGRGGLCKGTEADESLVSIRKREVTEAGLQRLRETRSEV